MKIRIEKIIKPMLLCLLMTFTFQLIAQNHSTINFTTQVPKKSIYSIFINGKMVTTIGENDNLEYKLYSEGRITIILANMAEKIIKTIDVKNGNTYYFCIENHGLILKYDFADEKKGKKMMEKNSNTLKLEEDKNNPYNKLPSTINDEGPKQGTCFLISRQGYLLTNYHVISGAKNIQIKGIGNDFSTIYGADVIAFDVDLDLALLKLKNQNIKFDTIPYSLALKTNPQGTKSFALGFPMTTTMGEEIKLTEGIINAKSGYKGSISQYQFSAAVQPGNSGSPLFNENGEIIGVINAKLQGAEGAGYAVKSQYAATFLNLIENIDIENNKTTISKLSLLEKVAMLKNFVFIVKTE